MSRSYLTEMLLTLFIFAVLCGSLSAQPDIPPPYCSPVVDCRFYQEDLVWAIDKQGNCLMIGNPCVFRKNNCFRYHQGLPLLKETTKEECQKLCNNKDCSKETGEPVCSKLGNNFCIFDNVCEHEKNMCNSGELWRIELDHFCEKHTSTSVCPKA